jgi:hypothetical protein
MRCADRLSPRAISKNAVRATSDASTASLLSHFTALRGGDD